MHAFRGTHKSSFSSLDKTFARLLSSANFGSLIEHAIFSIPHIGKKEAETLSLACEQIAQLTKKIHAAKCSTIYTEAKSAVVISLPLRSLSQTNAPVSGTVQSCSEIARLLRVHSRGQPCLSTKSRLMAHNASFLGFATCPGWLAVWGLPDAAAAPWAYFHNPPNEHY